jgi:hypothetical protein
MGLNLGVQHMRHYHMIYCTKKEQILHQKGTESKKGYMYKCEICDTTRNITVPNNSTDRTQLGLIIGVCHRTVTTAKKKTNKNVPQNTSNRYHYQPICHSLLANVSVLQDS